MKISVLTPTYNRANLIGRLYKSLVENSKYNVDIEWIIMDDGSTDDTKEIIKGYINENKINVKYFYQENQGKMIAISNLVDKSNGDWIIECDSDDYFTDDAFKIICDEYSKYEDDNKAYALCFLKYDQNGNNIGNVFQKKRTTMFDLYFKEGETGEKALVFFTNVRKKYKHELEKGEKFVTEARMYHKMDQDYDMICINKKIMVCEYQEQGYTKNITKQFIESPFGYYEYFKEILERDFSGVKFNKRLYAIKHFILFGYLTKSRQKLKNIKSLMNKVLCIILYVPGRIKIKSEFK